MASIDFLRDATAAGVDGLIVVDLPPEEDEELCLPARAAGLNFIRLATPTTDDKRLPKVLENTSGFVYYVSLTGITGAALADFAGVSDAVQRIKRHTNLPIAVGFGVKNADNAAQIARNADGVVVGSALVEALKKSLGEGDKASASSVEAVTALVASLAAGVRDARGRGRHESPAGARLLALTEALGHELVFQRRPAEDQSAHQARGARESLGEMPRERPARLPQGHRGQSLCRAGLRLSHALSRRGAA